MRPLHDIEGLELFDRESWVGDLTLLTWPAATVLNSRQSRYPCGAEEWVRSTVRAASWAAREGFCLLAGVDLATWELSAAVASDALGAVILLAGVPANWPSSRVQGRLDDFAAQFNLSHQAALVIPYRESPRSPKEQWPLRDRWIAEHADLLLPVSLREGGSLESLLSTVIEDSRIDDRFRTAYSPRRHAFPALPDVETAKESLRDDWEGWALHFTRSHAGPWPDETRLDYYRALQASEEVPPRLALATLGHILVTGHIYGSSRHMPLGRPAVGFTQLPPWEALQLMGWRRRYAEPSSEPYGIAVRSERLLKLGAKEVRYGSVEEAKTLAASERLFFQTVDPEGHDWSVERELRHPGGLQLSQFPVEEVRILVRSEGGAAELDDLPYELRRFT